MRESYARYAIDPYARIVRATMDKGIGHALNCRFLSFRAEATWLEKTGQSTHGQAVRL